MLKGIDLISCQGSLEKEIHSINYDSRLCGKNSLFIAVEGFKTNGHKYIESAINRGAVAIVYEEELKDKKDGITYVQVENSRLAQAFLANRFYGYPSENLSLIGVTGTNGKTSVSFLVSEILRQWNKEIGNIGTIGNFIGDTYYESKHTTPEALDLQDLLSRMVKKGVEYCVMEVSSHSLSLNRVEGTQFDIGIFTNLSQDHLDFHPNYEDYFMAKSKLFYMTSRANIINGDDPYGKKLIALLKDRDIKNYSFGIHSRCDFIAKNIEIQQRGVSFTFEGKGIRVDMFIRIPGMFSVYNALAAIVVGIIEGVPINIIKEALRNIPSVPGRFELVDIHKPYTVIIDYAHTPDGLKNVLNTIKHFIQGELILVFGCGGDRDKTKRPIMGEIAGSLADYCIITSDNPRSENPLSIIQDIIPGVEKTTCPYTVIENRKEAIHASLKRAKENDIILIAGKGHETYQILKEKVIPFDEKEIIKELLSKDEEHGKVNHS